MAMEVAAAEKELPKQGKLRMKVNVQIMLHCSLLRVDALTTLRDSRGAIILLWLNPVSPTPAGSLTASRPRQTFEGHRQLRQNIGSEVLLESDREDDRASRSGQSSHASLFEVRELEDSVGLQSPPSA